MIKKESLVSIGTFFKPHGIKGEVSASFDYEFDPSELRCIILEIEGIFVPFFIENARRRGSSSWLIKLDGVDSEKYAATFSNHDIYALADELPEGLSDEMEDGLYLYDLVGFKLQDHDNPIGIIEGIDDSTANILLQVRDNNGAIIYVPFAEDFITGINKNSETLLMSLPHGLIDLNV